MGQEPVGASSEEEEEGAEVVGVEVVGLDLGAVVEVEGEEGNWELSVISGVRSARAVSENGMGC